MTFRQRAIGAAKLEIAAFGPMVYGLATMWMLVAMIVAVRQTLDYTSTVRAIVVCLIAWVIAVAMSAILGGLLFVAAEELFS